MKKIKTIDIVAKEWFDRIYGNSYFSAYITVNYGLKSEANFYLPFQYGYGEQYKTECRDVLVKHGYLSKILAAPLWKHCKLHGIDLRARKIENCKKSDL